MKWQLQFVQLSNNHSLTEYWNFYFTEFSKLNKFMYVH